MRDYAGEVLNFGAYYQTISAELQGDNLSEVGCSLVDNDGNTLEPTYSEGKASWRVAEGAESFALPISIYLGDILIATVPYQE